MIRLMLGKMGSGKTACMVREMVLNNDEKTTFSNIILKKVKKKTVVQINRDMIFKEVIVKERPKSEPLKKMVLNADYWRATTVEHPEGINVVIDEAHTLMDSRRSMSNTSIIMNDFMALLRRILGDSGEGYGELVLITQLGRRLDVNARELATSVHYHRCHYKRTCDKCNYNFWENNEVYQKPKVCPRCGNRKMNKSDYIIEKWEFESMEALDYWVEHRLKTYQKHYYITDIQKYFQHYNTWQWENLISEY